MDKFLITSNILLYFIGMEPKLKFKNELISIYLYLLLNTDGNDNIKFIFAYI